MFYLKKKQKSKKIRKLKMRTNEYIFTNNSLFTKNNTIVKKISDEKHYIPKATFSNLFGLK